MTHTDRFRAKLRDLYEQHHSTAKVGRLLGVSKPTVRNWLQGHHDIAPRLVYRCAEPLGLAADEVRGVAKEARERELVYSRAWVARKKAEKRRHGQLNSALRAWR